MTIKMQRNEVNNDDYGFVARADVYDDHAAVDAAPSPFFLLPFPSSLINEIK